MRVSYLKILNNGRFKVVLDEGLLQPIPEDVEAELDKILDAEDID